MCVTQADSLRGNRLGCADAWFPGICCLPAQNATPCRAVRLGALPRATGLGLRRARTLEQGLCVLAEERGNVGQSREPQVRPAALKLLDPSDADVGCFGKLLLRHALVAAQLLDADPDVGQQLLGVATHRAECVSDLIAENT